MTENEKLQIAIEYLEAIAKKSKDIWSCNRAIRALELIKLNK